MAEIHNITNWNIKSWLHTGGTREKYYVENPADNKEYFFKVSIAKFPSEFWSEIISSKIGKHLGFNLLDYNIGVSYNTVGCICESMIDQAIEELEHGINLIKNSVKEFHLSERPIIIFSEVEKSFYNYKGFILKFIDVLVFDAIIGNQDRHSENWAIIRSLDVSNERFNMDKLLKKSYDLYKSTGIKLNDIPFKKFFLKYMNKAALVHIEFSPIYDSGSSLGREISEDKIQAFLDDDNKIRKYIRKGVSEIKWEKGNKKINHFEILKKIKSKYPQQIEKRINEVLNKYNANDIETIISKIDDSIPDEFHKTKLSLQRKKLITKFIQFRVEQLKEVIS